MSGPERHFVRELLRRKRNLWLFRCHHRRFCGDFIVVDMSGPEPERRPAMVLEVKEREPVHEVGEVAYQLRQASEAIQELGARGVLGASSEVSTLVVAGGWVAGASVSRAAAQGRMTSARACR